MGATSFDRQRFVVAAAKRLRLIQFDFAEEDEKTRREYLAEALKESLDSVPLAEQKQFLEELEEQFPMFDNAPAPAPAPAPAAPPPMDLAGMLKGVLEQGQKLPEHQRQEIVKQLQERWGIAPKQEKVDGVSQAVRPALGITSAQAIDNTRVAELSVMLIDFVKRIDPLVYKTWRLFDATEGNGKGPIQGTITRFARGEQNVPLAQELGELRTLIAALMNAFATVPKAFHQRHLLRFDPEEIKEAVKVQGGGSWLKGFEVKCWEQYCRMAPELAESAVQAGISRIVVDLVGNLRGTAKPSSE